jgi:hypothetical protein
MAEQVVSGAMLMCTFGVAPCPLVATSAPTVLVGGLPAATIADCVPETNIATFGMCTTPSNPEVATATAAALGVLTPMPCIPVTVGPWVPGAPTVLINSLPALDNTSKCMCAWGGVISITEPGQFNTTVP